MLNIYDQIKAAITRKNTNHIDEADVRDCLEIVLQALPYSAKKELCLRLQMAKIDAQKRR